MKTLSLILSTVALSTVAFGQIPAQALLGDAFYQIGYAANLNIGDSVVNLTNTGASSTVAFPVQDGNICVNVYTFDPQEEEIACCSCLVTPDGLNSLSVKADLTSNPLTPAIPTSVVIKLLGSLAAADQTGAFTVCNPSTVNAAAAPNQLTRGMLAWGSTLEPNGNPGTYGVVHVDFRPAELSVTELAALTSTCSFIQEDGSGFGVCKSCRLGALSGSKK